jgi:hypothetical protein
MLRFNKADGEVAKRFSLMPSALLVRQSTTQIVPTSYDVRSSLLPRNFHNHPFVPLPIKLGMKDPLPRHRIEFAAGNRHYNLMMD